MASSIFSDDGRNPGDPASWLQQIRSTVSYRASIRSADDVKIENVYLYDADRKVPSASKIGKEDFLHFKVLWKPHRAADLCRNSGQVLKEQWAQYVEPQVAKSAVGLVNGANGSIQAYLNDAERNTKIDGQLANVHRLQQLVQSVKDDHNKQEDLQKVGLVLAPRRSARLGGGSGGGDGGVGAITHGMASVHVGSSPTATAAGKQPAKKRGRMRTVLAALTPGRSKHKTKAGAAAPAAGVAPGGDPSGRLSAAGSVSSSAILNSVLSPGGMLPLNAQAEDEEVVNLALIAFLMTLGLLNPAPTHAKVQWMPSRKQFFVGDNVCEARTDGYLKAFAFPEAALAICEVKPFTRQKVRTELEWQEGCQMAGWISYMAQKHYDDDDGLGLLHSTSDNLRRRLLVSQDHEEIFITIAEYGDKYVDYLFGGSRPRKSGSSGGRGASPAAVPPLVSGGGSSSGWVDDGFLTMNTYGPFSTMSKSNRRALCTVLYAFTEQLAVPLKNAGRLDFGK